LLTSVEAGVKFILIEKEMLVMPDQNGKRSKATENVKQVKVVDLILGSVCVHVAPK
jgi:hypothetical protein